MQSIGKPAGAPPARLDVPPIDVVRPTRCPRCLVPARVSGALNLWGHGKRRRDVIVPAVAGERLVSVWVWRFLCRRCGAGCSVSAVDVLFRHRYTLAAIVSAWFLAVRPPIGDGYDDEAVYALMGVDRRVPGRDPDRAGKPRWRSLSRWAASIPAWWPTRPAVGATWRLRACALLVGFVPGDGGRDGAIRRALAAHTAGGRPM